MPVAPILEITGSFNTSIVNFNNFGSDPVDPANYLAVPVAGIYQFAFQAQAMWNGINPAPDDTLIAWGVSLIHASSDTTVLETVNHRAAPFLTVSTYTASDQPTVSLSITDTFDMALGDTVSWAIFDYNPYDAGGGDWESYIVMGHEGTTYSSTFVTCSRVG